jgi:HNH endonuclease
VKALGIAAAAAIALAPFLVVATIPVVAQAASQYRISPEPTLPEPAPTTVTRVQTQQVVPPSPPPPSTIPVVAADEDPTQPGWHVALRYGVLVIVMSLVAWPLGLSLQRTTDTPPIPPRPKPRRAGRGALAVRSALTFPTIDHQCAEVKRMVLVAAGHRCAVPTCRPRTTEIAHIVPESQSHDDLFENLFALCPNCYTRYKRNLGILSSRYSDFERRVFDQIAETDRRSFIVEAGFEVLLLHAVKDGLLKRVELSPVAIQRGEPTHHKYEVTDAGLNFVSRYIQGEDIS